jgi:hypothetical protein
MAACNYRLTSSTTTNPEGASKKEDGILKEKRVLVRMRQQNLEAGMESTQENYDYMETFSRLP